MDAGRKNKKSEKSQIREENKDYSCPIGRTAKMWKKRKDIEGVSESSVSTSSVSPVVSVILYICSPNFLYCIVRRDQIVGLKAVLFQREQEAKRFSIYRRGKASGNPPPQKKSPAFPSPALPLPKAMSSHLFIYLFIILSSYLTLLQTRNKAKETVWTKQNKGISDRSRRDEEALKAEHKTTEDVEAKLQEKARLYEQFSTRPPPPSSDRAR